MICSRKEFEDLCGISRANYTTYRTREKIVEQFDEHGNVYIDTDHPDNKAFYESRKVHLEKKVIEKVSESIEPVFGYPAPSKPQAKSKTPYQGKPSRKPNLTPSETKGGVKFDLEVDKLDADVRLKELTIAVKEHELNTLLGRNIPSAIVMESFAQLSKSLLTGYRDYIEQEISIFCHRNKVSDKERVSIMSKLVTGLNSAHTKSVNEGRSTMKEGLKKHKINNTLEDEQGTD
jgi:hypothetical protein